VADDARVSKIVTYCHPRPESCKSTTLQNQEDLHSVDTCCVGRSDRSEHSHTCGVTSAGVCGGVAAAAALFGALQTRGGGGSEEVGGGDTEPMVARLSGRNRFG